VADWKDGEEQLRRNEVKWLRLVGIAEAIIGLAAVLAAGVAVLAALAAREAVQVAAEGIELQATEDRLATAVESVGGERAAQRAAGFGLLRRQVEDLLTEAESEEDRRAALGMYTASLDVLENYLHDPVGDPAEPSPADPPAGLGYGRPDVPEDVHYAANEVRSLMRLRRHVLALDVDASVLTPAPSVDLSGVQLYGHSWAEVDFAWLGGGYFAGIDLRGANLSASHWDGASLPRAHLQCANLVGVTFVGADLTGADLRGADLSGADLTEATLDGIDLEGATWSHDTKGLEAFTQTLDGPRADGTDCLQYEPYHRMPEDAAP
jgi:Pentapeptide repeats (8 copies)